MDKIKIKHFPRTGPFDLLVLKKAHRGLDVVDISYPLVYQHQIKTNKQTNNDNKLI